MPSISVVIPAFNRLEQIKRALASVRKQTYAPDEIIVVDDGSSDGTAAFLAARHPEVVVLRQPHRGQAAARNAGIAAAGGEFIAFLDSDDVWLPDKLRAQVAVLRAHPELGLLATRKYRNPAAYPAPPVSRPRVRRFPFIAFLKRATFNTPTVIVPRRILEAVGCFDESLPASEDWDLWARIAYRHPVARIEQPLVAVYESADSISLCRRRKYLNDAGVLSRWNPARPGTYDTDGRLSPLTYQRCALSFAIPRVLRLLRHVNPQAAQEFLSLVEEKIGLAPLPRLLARSVLRLGGKWKSR